MDIKDLLTKYRTGTITDSEMELLETWYLKWIPESEEISMERLEDLELEVQGLLPGAKKTMKLWPGIAAAAAVLALAVFGLWFYAFNDSDAARQQTFTSNADIRASGNQALLTLPNGKQLSLRDNKTGISIHNDRFTYEDGGLVNLSFQNFGERKSLPATAKMLSVSTPNGRTYQVVLPDGSKVLLNAGSSIKFASNFKSLSERRVELNGEAYFEVFKNKSQPFIVSSRNQEIRVLGTHFNVSAYSDESNTKTTLLEGSIVINKQVLKPGEQAVQANGDIQIKRVDADDAIAWTNNQFIFESESIQNIMKMISRWYDIDVMYEGEMPDEKFGGAVSRFENLSKVLEVLESTGFVHFKIEGRRVFVTK